MIVGTATLPSGSGVLGGDDSAYTGWFRGWSRQPDGSLDYQTCGGAAYLPKLDLTHRPAHDHVLRAAAYWIEQAGIDGWRLDVPFKVGHDFWEEFRATVRAVAPGTAYLLGEVCADAAPWLDVFDGVTNYRQRSNILGFCLEDSLDGEDFAQEAVELARAHDGAANWMINLVGSHDTARVLTMAGGDVERVLCAMAAMFTSPAYRSSTTATRSASTAVTTRDVAPRCPGIRRAEHRDPRRGP